MYLKKCRKTLKKSSFNEKKTQSDQEILLGHIAELDADSQTGWEKQTDKAVKLFPFPGCKGETFLLS